MLMGLADAGPAAAHDLDLLGPTLHALRAIPSARTAAGAARWRATWRVNRAWLESLDPGDEALKFPGLRRLVLDVLIEHLGRRPDLAGLVRGMLVKFAEAEPKAAEEVIGQLSNLGGRGWGVLLPMLQPAQPGDRFPVPDAIRRSIFLRATIRPAVLPLVHHHAHGVIASAVAEGKTDLLMCAARVLERLGPAAGMAVPDLLALAVRLPNELTGLIVGKTVPKIAAGFPNTPAAIIRTLHRIRTAGRFGEPELTVFEKLARALAELAPDAAPALVENTATDPRVPDLLLQQPGWKDAPPGVRRRHARTLADRLASPRAEVRTRAAELLRHYRDQMPAVWPALVAALAGPDENAAAVVLPYFRYLGPVADAVAADLVALFREPNPPYAARAVVALWRLGRMPLVSADLRAAVEADPESGWGWAVLRGVVDRVSQAHGLLRELADVFAASPAAVVEKVDALVNPPESEDEAKFAACVPRPGDPAAPTEVQWDAVHRLVPGGPAGPLLFVAFMCEYGSGGFGNQKLWMIKAQRELTRNGLAEAKAAVERMVGVLPRPGAPTADRRQAVREFFANRTELPSEITELLNHPLSWFRWAGLELADAWELTPEQAKGLTEDRVWDRSPRVRERALRMVGG
jgi:ribosomal protein L7/L12